MRRFLERFGNIRDVLVEWTEEEKEEPAEEEGGEPKKVIRVVPEKEIETYEKLK